MAGRLARAGVNGTVWNRTRSKAKALTKVGCSVAGAIGDLHDVVFTMVSTPTSTCWRSAGEDGLLAHPEHFTTWSGVAFLAAPVSGNGKVVRARGLTPVVSGLEETYHRVAHLLDHLGKGSTYVGDGDVSRPAKICHAAATAATVRAAVSSGRIEEDFAILLELQAASSGITLKPENVVVDDGLGA